MAVLAEVTGCEAHMMLTRGNPSAGPKGRRFLPEVHVPAPEANEMLRFLPSRAADDTGMPNGVSLRWQLS